MFGSLQADAAAPFNPVVKWSWIAVLGLSMAGLSGYASRAATVETIYNFGAKASDPSYPYGITPVGGVLFGLASNGGPNGKRAELLKIELSQKRETSFKVFKESEVPNGLTFTNGALYGSESDKNSMVRTADIFKIDPATHAHTVLYTFAGGSDGIFPQNLLTESNGLLYGVTLDGGSLGFGSIFRFDPTTNTETTLHSQTCAEGAGLVGSLVSIGTALYGAAPFGGPQTCRSLTNGTVFKFDIPAETETTAYRFQSRDSTIGSTPDGTLVGDEHGLYGIDTCAEYGYYCTHIYKVSLQGHATLVYDFGITNSETSTRPSLAVFRNGVIYGFTESGGSNGKGSLFTLDTKTGSLTTLYSFSGLDGSYPSGLIYFKGAFYGTSQGGAYGTGAVFRLVP